MKRIVLLAILAFGIVNFGCEKDSDEYYVKYVAGAQTIYSGVGLDILIRNENNETTAYTSTVNSWSMTIGPVEKGFSGFLSVTGKSQPSHTTLIANIYVSKNDGPFALKESGESATSSGPVLINYTIDF